MDKIASDAYSQGAYEALQQMQVSGHVKQAAANYLIKESGAIMDKLIAAKEAVKNFGYKDAAGAIGDRLKTLGPGGLAKRQTANPGVAEDVLKSQLLKDRIGVGLGGAGLLAGGAGLAGAFDDPEPEGWDALTPAQQAAIIGGGAAAVGGAGYGLSQLM